MVWGNQNRQRPDQQTGPQQNTNADPQGGGQQQPTPPQSPGGGALSNPIFSGDHVLESIAQGNGTLRAGARGPAVRALQTYLIQAGLGTHLGRWGADGSFGNGTTNAVRAWQTARGLASDGVIGKDTLSAMDKDTSTVNAPAPGQQQTPAGGATTQAGGPSGSRNGGLPDDFQQVWDAHPHNYLPDASQNTASDDLQVAQGWRPDEFSNTCAIRMSIMWNQLGGDYKITREKAKAAGIPAGRIPYSRKTGWYYILSAKEMWTYVEKHFGKPHQQWPENGRRFKNAQEFQTAFDSEIEPVVSGRKGLVAFDKIFGYSGTGHVDVFNGKQLSDGSWYPSQALKVWYL